MSGNSWKLLTTPVKGQASDVVLRLAHADYEVVLSPVHVFDKFKNKFVEVPDRFTTGRIVSDALQESGYRLENWEVVKDRYVVVQNSDIYARSEAIVAAYKGRANLDSCGVLDGGRKFFTAIATGSLEIIGSGDKDYIDSYLIAMTSHDGSIPVCYYSLDVRRCNNAVYRFNYSGADFALRKRHTPNKDANDIEVSEAIQMRDSWTTAFKSVMTEMLCPISDSKFDEVLSTEWNPEKASSKSKRDHIDSVRDTIQELYRSDYNSGLFGYTKWAVFNAIIEYVDFHRNIPALEAAQHSIEIDNYSHRLKVSLFDALRSI